MAPFHLEERVLFILGVPLPKSSSLSLMYSKGWSLNETILLYPFNPLKELWFSSLGVKLFSYFSVILNVADGDLMLS